MMIGIGIAITNCAMYNPRPAEEPGESYGPEHSTAAGGGNWNGGGVWSENQALNRLSCGATGIATNSAGQAAIIGRSYRLVWQLVSIGGGLGTGTAAQMGGAPGAHRTTPGTYEDTVVAVSTGKPQFICDDEDGCVVGAWSFREIL